LYDKYSTSRIEERGSHPRLRIEPQGPIYTEG